MANARKTASRRVNSKKGVMRGASGASTGFQRQAGSFQQAAGKPQKKATPEFAVSKLIPFL